MKPSELWVFDSFQRHEVHNNGGDRRVHLVLDTVRGERLWELMDEALSEAAGEPLVVMPSADSSPELEFERFNAPKGYVALGDAGAPVVPDESTGVGVSGKQRAPAS